MLQTLYQKIYLPFLKFLGKIFKFQYPARLIVLLKIIYIPEEWRDTHHWKYWKQHGISIKKGKIIGTKYTNLVSWLDPQSISTINETLIRLYKKSLSKHWFNKNRIWYEKGFYPKEFVQQRNDIVKSRNSYGSYWKLSIPWWGDSIFYYKCWLGEVASKNLAGKSILDCGAFIWDSALMFSKELEEYDKIYCFEPQQENYSLLKQTIRLNNLENVLIPIKKWVGEKMIKASISERGNESSIGNDTWSTEEIEITTIDQFTKENQINVWLIKWDVEGQELGSIRWAEATIKQFKPILLISIYHTWKDFFEIKPLLESRNLWYIYKVINANPFHPYYETMLIAY